MISRTIYSATINAGAFLLAAYLLPGFRLGGDVLSFLALVVIFTLINSFIRPIIKMVLTPLIWLTLGLFSLVINAGILYVVDIYSSHISIDGLTTLVYATIIITLVHLILSGPATLFRRRYHL